MQREEDTDINGTVFVITNRDVAKGTHTEILDKMIQLIKEHVTPLIDGAAGYVIEIRPKVTVRILNADCTETLRTFSPQ